MESEIVAARASNGLQAMLRTLGRVAARLSSFALFVGIANFATGMWLFEGTGRDKWIVIGGIISFGPPLAATLATYRVRRTADLAPQVVAEVRSFDDVAKGALGVLIDGDSGHVTGLRARGLGTLRGEVYGRRREFPALWSGVKAITTVPKLLVWATFGTLLAGALGTVLLIGGLID